MKDKDQQNSIPTFLVNYKKSSYLGQGQAKGNFVYLLVLIWEKNKFYNLVTLDMHSHETPINSWNKSFVTQFRKWPSTNIYIQVNLDMTVSMGPGRFVRHMQNPSYTYDTYLICMRLGPSILSVICRTMARQDLYPSSPVHTLPSHTYNLALRLNININRIPFLVYYKKY